MSGRCIRCGKQMKWIGKIWLHCEHCGQLQVWPTSVDYKEREEKDDKN